MGNRRWVVLALAAALAACASAGEGESEAPPSDEIAAQAATIRWLIQNNDSALRSSATAYCVGSGSGLVVTEPPLALIRALRGTLPPVQPISRCAWARDVVVGRRVVDELSEAPALALWGGRWWNAIAGCRAEAGSASRRPARRSRWGVAQPAERRAVNAVVAGSNPASPAGR